MLYGHVDIFSPFLGIQNYNESRLESIPCVSQRTRDMHQTINFAFNQHYRFDLNSSTNEVYHNTFHQTFGSVKYDAFPQNEIRGRGDLNHEKNSNAQTDYRRRILQNADHQKGFNNPIPTDIFIKARSQSYGILTKDRKPTMQDTSTASPYPPVSSIDKFGIGNGSFSIFGRSSSGFAGRTSENFHRSRKNKLSLDHGRSDHIFQTNSRKEDSKSLALTQTKISAESQNADRIKSTEKLRFYPPRHESISTDFFLRSHPKQAQAAEEIQYAMYRDTIPNIESHPNIQTCGAIRRPISKVMPLLYTNVGNPTSLEVYQEGKSSEGQVHHRNYEPNLKSLKRISNPGWYNENDAWRRTKVAKIDEIFDIFVPAMGSTSIKESFIVKLINLHRNKSNESEEEKMSRPTMIVATPSKLFPGETKNAYSGLTKDDVVDHFISLEESFTKFASRNKTFKELCVGDRTELLKQNSIRFVMVSKNM